MSDARDALDKARAAYDERQAQLSLRVMGRPDVAKLSADKQGQLDALVRRRDLRAHEEELARIEWMRLRKSKDRERAVAAYHALDQAVKMAASARWALRDWCSREMGEAATPQSFDAHDE